MNMFIAEKEGDYPGMVRGPYYDFAPNAYMRSAMYIYSDDCSCSCCVWMRENKRNPDHEHRHQNPKRI